EHGPFDDCGDLHAVELDAAGADGLQVDVVLLAPVCRQRGLQDRGLLLVVGQVYKEDLVKPPLAQQLRRQAGHVVGRDEQEALARALCIQVNSVPSWSFDVPPSAPPSLAPANIFSISSIINGTGAMRLAGPDSVRNLSKVHSQDAQRLTRAEAKQNGLFRATWWATKSAASAGSRSACPSAAWYSIATFWPSINPASASPARKAASAGDSG